MIPSTTPSTAAISPVDEDLAEQARPGYGIPSQDLRTGAQTAPEPEDAEREAHSALMGGGISGALGGAAAGTLVSPDDLSADAVEGDHLAQSARGPANKRDSK